ncbi:MAG: hypothetical protein ABIZ09_19355 [Rhodoferax sp.]
MSLLFLEALGAGLLFIGIIWWTMFSGRKNGEMPTEVPEEDVQRTPARGNDLPPSAAYHQDEIDR